MTEDKTYIVAIRVRDMLEAPVLSDKGNCEHCFQEVWVSDATRKDVQEFFLICLQCYFVRLQALGEDARPQIGEHTVKLIERAGFTREQAEDLIEDIMDSASVQGP